MDEIKLPGDFVENVEEEQHPFVNHVGDYLATKVIGVQTNDHFQILKQ